jgi:hypothetical protein
MTGASSANPILHGVDLPYAVFENEDDVTTDTPTLLAERLEEALTKLWGLKKS